MNADNLEHVGSSLITIKGKNECLGDLWFAEGHGCFDPNYGQVPVSKEAAQIHNQALDQARLEGLDKNCQIGQGGFAYLTGSPKKVTTFSGTVISSDVSIKGKSIAFRRNGKTYRGILRKNEDLFRYRQVS